MIVRVVRSDGEFVGEIETPEAPGIGDCFWWQTHGPYRVTGKTWHFPLGFNPEKPHILTLEVEEIPKHIEG